MPNTHVPAAGGAMPAVQSTTFLPLTPQLRSRLEATVESLIGLLDELEPDPDLEPYLAGIDGNGGHDREGDLDINEGDDGPDDEEGGDAELSLGAPERHPSAYSSAWIRPGELGYATGGSNSQVAWAGGSNIVRSDECEALNEDGGDIIDDRHDAATWGESMDQRHLGCTWPDDDEPSLGFVGIATGWRGEPDTADREGDDEREQDPAEYGIGDADGLLEQVASQGGAAC